jgi:hypothetical protein
MTAFKTRCSAIVPNNGIVKLLLTVTSEPNSQDEHLLLNLLKSRVEFEQDDIVEVTLRRVNQGE